MAPAVELPSLQHAGSLPLSTSSLAVALSQALAQAQTRSPVFLLTEVPVRRADTYIHNWRGQIRQSILQHNCDGEILERTELLGNLWPLVLVVAVSDFTIGYAH